MKLMEEMRLFKRSHSCCLYLGGPEFITKNKFLVQNSDWIPRKLPCHWAAVNKKPISASADPNLPYLTFLSVPFSLKNQTTSRDGFLKSSRL
jgi:hypothetical protein